MNPSACVMFAYEKDGFVILGSTDGGASWSTQQRLDAHLDGLTCAGESCLAGGAEGGVSIIRRSNNAGVAWMEAAVPPEPLVGPLMCRAADDCWAAGSDDAGTAGHIFHSADFATTWQEHTPKGYVPSINSLFCRDAQHCWASGSDRIFMTSDAGTTWSTTVLPLLTFIDEIACSATTCYAVGVDLSGDEAADRAPGYIIASVGNGGEWMTVPSNTRRLSAIACPPSGNCIAVGEGDPVTLIPASAAPAP